MKAPETIFLHGYSFDDEPCKNWTLEPLNRGMRGYAVQNVEYIRKDALLEWAKGQKARLKQGFKKDWKNEDTLNGGRLMLDKLINKLNSM